MSLSVKSMQSWSLEATPRFSIVGILWPRRGGGGSICSFHGGVVGTGGGGEGVYVPRRSSSRSLRGLM